MTVSSTTNRVAYTGNGTANPLAVAFPFLATTDLVVVETVIATGVSTTKAITTDYTVTGTPDANGYYTAGGSVVPVSSIAATKTWTIYRDPALTQLVLHVDNDPLPAVSIDSPVDKLTMICQRLKDILLRTVRGPDGDSASLNMQLSSSIARSSTIPSFDASGNVETIISKAQVQAAIAAYLTNSTITAATAAYAATLAAAKAMFAAPLVLAAGLALVVAGRTNTNDGYQGVFVYDSTDSTTTFLSDGLGFVDNQSRRFKRVYNGVDVFANWFGAVGDVNDAGVGTDNTTALQNWLTSLGIGYYGTPGANQITGPGHGILPIGKYKYTATLTIPAQARVSGVPSKSALRPSSAVTTAAVIQTSGSTLDGIVIDGLNAGNIIGLSIGASGLVSNGVTRQVQSVRFTGAAGYALVVQNGVIWQFEDGYFGDSARGLQILDSGQGTPTTLTFTACTFKGNTHHGMWMGTGQECQFFGCVFEQNGDEGTYIDVSAGGGGAIQNILFTACYWESNQRNLAVGVARHAKYHLYAKGTGIKVRDAFFQNDATEARAMQFDTAPDFVVDNCDMNAEAGQISVLSGSTGTFVNWPESNGGIDAVIVNAGTSNLLYDTRGTFTPGITFATPGDLAVAYTFQVGRYERNGNRVTATILLKTSSFTWTTASGALSLTNLPYTSKTVTNGDTLGPLSWQGITKANYTNWVAHIGSNSSVVGIYGSGSGQAQVSLAAADMPTGGTVILETTITYEV